MIHDERDYPVRAAEAADIGAMQTIEVAAGRAFATVGMELVASDDPLPAGQLLTYVRDGRAWVATGPDDAVVAYLIADWIDGLAHVEQVSVHPDQAGRRIGAALIEQAAQWARRRGSPALTLTTFADVAWNAPYYEKLGFRRLADDELTPGLLEIRAEEAAHGLDQWPRLGMRRELNAP